MFQLLFIVWALFCIYHLAVSEPILIELYLTQNLKVNCIWSENVLLYMQSEK